VAHPNDPKTVRITDGYADLVPVRVLAVYRRNGESREETVDSSLITHIQHEQILDVGHRRRTVFGGELRVRTSTRQLEHYAVVTGVARELVDLR